jgi:hypothetical protein
MAMIRPVVVTLVIVALLGLAFGAAASSSAVAPPSEPSDDTGRGRDPSHADGI